MRFGCTVYYVPERERSGLNGIFHCKSHLHEWHTVPPKGICKAESRITDAPFTSVYLPNRKLENVCLSQAFSLRNFLEFCCPLVRLGFILVGVRMLFGAGNVGCYPQPSAAGTGTPACLARYSPWWWGLVLCLKPRMRNRARKHAKSDQNMSTKGNELPSALVCRSLSPHGSILPGHDPALPQFSSPSLCIISQISLHVSDFYYQDKRSLYVASS